MRLFHFVLGLLLIPFCWASSQTVWDLVTGLHSGGSMLPPPLLALVGGFLVWILIYYTMTAPVRSYVLAHELTHALWASLMGAEVSRLKVGASGGSVTLSKSNFLITLAPYFFPLYTVLVIAVYYVCGVFYPVEKYLLVWLGLIGFSWGFHFTFTLTTLLQHQTDIQEYGHVFSYAVIYLFNVLGIALWIILVSPVTLEKTISLLVENSVHVVYMVRQASRALFQFKFS